MNRLLAATLLVALVAILLATPTLAMGPDERRLKGGGMKVCTRLGIPAYIKMLALALYWYFIDAASLFSQDAHQFSPFRLEYKSISGYQGPQEHQGPPTPHRGASVEGMYSTTVSHTHVPVLMVALCCYFVNAASPFSRINVTTQDAHRFSPFCLEYKSISGFQGPKNAQDPQDVERQVNAFVIQIGML